MVLEKKLYKLISLDMIEWNMVDECYSRNNSNSIGRIFHVHSMGENAIHTVHKTMLARSLH